MTATLTESNPMAETRNFSRADLRIDELRNAPKTELTFISPENPEALRIRIAAVSTEIGDTACNALVSLNGKEHSINLIGDMPATLDDVYVRYSPDRGVLSLEKPQSFVTVDSDLVAPMGPKDPSVLQTLPMSQRLYIDDEYAWVSSAKEQDRMGAQLREERSRTRQPFRFRFPRLVA